MDEFSQNVNLIIQKLNASNCGEDAEKLKNALRISNSSLEILGEIRQQLALLEKKKILSRLECDSTVKNVRKFISKYWPGY